MLGGIVRPRSGTIPSRDEEHGKRDDDFRPRVSPQASAASWLAPWRWRRRRLFAVLVIVLTVYAVSSKVSYKDISSLQSSLQSFEDYIPQYPSFRQTSRPALTPIRTEDLPVPNAVPAPAANKAPKSEVPVKEPGGDSANHDYDGKVRFERLPATLQKVQRASYGSSSGNILYAVSSLRSAANLIPMACEMAAVKKNGVHMAFMGRNELPLKEILAVNGVSQGDCNVTFHDARADRAASSSDARAERSVLGAVKHINEYTNPQAIVMDDSRLEDAFFVSAMRRRAEDYYKTLIEVPGKKYEEFIWMTRLDANSLENWHKPSVEVVIQAPQHSSGSLIRLLQSFTKAEYAGLRSPRLTIELPPKLEPFALQWLADLQWPSAETALPLQPSLLTLRHRIASRQLTAEQASVRFVESFYPQDPDSHHILVLSPQAELSPLYFQHLYYNILHYRYSADWWASSDIMGISLDRPTSFLSGENGLQNPVIADMHNTDTLSVEHDKSANAPFLYQAATTGASLIFGSKWAEFHDFLQNRIAANQRGLSKKQAKLITETEPAWAEYLLELMRARGWSMLHPAKSLVTLHNELAQVPEEFMRPPTPAKKSATSLKEDRKSTLGKGEAFLTADEAPAIIQHKETPESSRSANVPLHRVLPFDGHLPELGSLPLLTHAGKSHLRIAIGELTEEYVPYFRAEIGGCSATRAKENRVAEPGRTDDLFCFTSAKASIEQEGEDKDADPPGRTSQSGSASSMEHNVVLPGLERNTFEMMDHPAVEVGPPSHQRQEGGFGPRKPVLRGLEISAPEG